MASSAVPDPFATLPTLRRQLGVWLAVLLSVTVLVLGAGLYVTVGQQVQHAARVRLLATTVSGLERAEEPDEADTSSDPNPKDALDSDEALDTRAPRIVEALEGRRFFTRVARLDGTVLAASTRVRRPPALDSAQCAQIAATLPPGPPRGPLRRHVEVYEDARSGRRWTVLLLPLYRHGQLAGVLQVAEPAGDQSALLRDLRRLLIAGGVMALVGALTVAFFLARRLAAPLEALEAAARRVADGDFEARAGDVAGSRETQAVAHAFDDMIGQMKESMATQQRFVADASHELKTPLTAIGGMAEMLASGRLEGDAQGRARALETIEREVDRMGRLVSDLLALSRAEQEARPRESLAIDVGALLDEAASDACAADAGSTRPRLRIDPPRPPLQVVGSREELVRALRNLLDNAFAATPATGTVTLRATAEKADVVIDVSDTGIGIEAVHVPHLFDRFYRGDPSRSRRTGGSGLGLAIVKAIVIRHGGHVGIESTPGAGTRVWVALPRSTRLPPAL